MAESIYSFPIKAADDSITSLDAYRGKVLLIVNVASRCGYTPQYEGLESLYKKYKSEGLVVLGFPCNQFGSQEPGDMKEIVTFCKSKYDVDFPIFHKIDVNGDNADPLYKWLKNQKHGILGTEGIKWNFTKFLVSRSGEVIERFAPATEPKDIEDKIKKALGDR